MMANTLTSADFQAVAQMLSDNYGVTVICEGYECRTDGKKIYIPEVPALVDNPRLLALVRSFLDHEVGHIVGNSDFDALQGIVAKYGPTGKAVFNPLEDARVERVMSDLWAGCGLNLRLGTDMIFSQFADLQNAPESRDDRKQLDLLLKQLGDALYCTASGRAMPWYVRDERVKAMVEKFRPQIESVPLMPDCATVKGLALMILEHLAESDKQKQQKQQQQDGQPKKQTGKGKGGSPGALGAKPDPDAAPSDADDEAESEKQQQQQQQQQDEANGVTPDMRKVQDALDKAAEKATQRAYEMDMKYRDDTRVVSASCRADEEMRIAIKEAENGPCPKSEYLEYDDEGWTPQAESEQGGSSTDSFSTEANGQLGGTASATNERAATGGIATAIAQAALKELGQSPGVTEDDVRRGDVYSFLPLHPKLDAIAPGYADVTAAARTRFTKRVDEATSGLRGHLTRLLLSEDKTHRRAGFRTGRPSANRMAHLTLGLTERPMSRLVRHQAPATACGLLVDGSESMERVREGHRLSHHAAVSAAAFCSVLDGAGHPCAVWTFQRTYLNLDNLFTGPDRYARIESLRNAGFRGYGVTLFETKGWNERYAHAIPKLTHSTEYRKGGTPMGEAMMMAGDELLARREKRKVLIVFGDGEPHGPELVTEATRRLVSRGVEVSLIGICTPAMERLAPGRAVSVMDPSKLGRAMLDELEKCLHLGA